MLRALLWGGDWRTWKPGRLQWLAEHSEGIWTELLLDWLLSPRSQWHTWKSHVVVPPVTFWFAEESFSPVLFSKARGSGANTGLGTRRPGFHLRRGHQLGGRLSLDLEDLPSAAPCGARGWSLSTVLKALLSYGSGFTRVQGAGLGGCQAHTVINQQVRNGKLNSKGGRREEFFIGLLNRCQRIFLFFFNRKPCLWQFSSRRPELNISIFGERHIVKCPLPRWRNGAYLTPQPPFAPQTSSFFLIQTESILNLVSIIHLSFFFFLTIYVCFLNKYRVLLALGTSCN